MGSKVSNSQSNIESCRDISMQTKFIMDFFFQILLPRLVLQKHSLNYSSIYYNQLIWFSSVMAFPLKKFWFGELSIVTRSKLY